MSGEPASELDSMRGWIVVVLGVLILLTVWGTIFTFTVYAGDIAAAYGLSRLRVTSLFSITTAAFFVVGGLVGVVVARIPLRPVVAASGLALGAAVVLLQLVSSYAGLAVAFALFGTAGGTVFLVVISLVPQWFDAYEGRAMGVTVTGNGLGVLVLPVVWVWLLGRLDFRGAFMVVGGAATAVVLAASLFYRRPADLDAAPALPVDRDWLADRLADRRFLVVLVGYPMLWSWYLVLSATLVDILTAAGIAETVAATAFGVIGGISILTRLGSGAVADVIGQRVTMLVGLGLAALGVFALVATETVPAMYVTLAIFGVGLGAMATLFSPIVIGRFGAEDATALVGMLHIVEASMAFGGPIAMSVLVDLTGGYDVPLVLLGVVTLAGAGLFSWGTRPVDGP